MIMGHTVIPDDFGTYCKTHYFGTYSKIRMIMGHAVNPDDYGTYSKNRIIMGHTVRQDYYGTYIIIDRVIL